MTDTDILLPPIPSLDPANHFWFVGDNDAEVYSTAARRYVPFDEAVHIVGDNTSRVMAWGELEAYLRAKNVPPYHSVSSYRIVRRLEDAGKIDEADAALESNRTLLRRFYTVGTIPADDPNAIALLVAIGADPAVI